MRDQIVSSVWFLTIISNIPDKQANREKIDKFNRAVRKVFLSSNILNFLKVIVPETEKKQQLIQEVSSDIETEVGDKQHRVHCHGTVKVFHYSTLEFNQPKLSKYFVQETGHQVAIQAKVSGGSAEETAMRRYMSKTRKVKRALTISGVVVGIDGKVRKYSN
jgi:hypothetical protein